MSGLMGGGSSPFPLRIAATRPGGTRMIPASATLLLAGVLLVLPAGSALAAPRSCGVETALSQGRIFTVKATRTKCETAKAVTGGWFNLQAHGASAKRVYDGRGRRWACRVTEEATGTDPGYNPYTHVRCSRKRSGVRFLLRS